MKCPYCGRMNPDNAQRYNCGYKFLKYEENLRLTESSLERKRKARLTSGLILCGISGILFFIAIFLYWSNHSTSGGHHSLY